MSEKWRQRIRRVRAWFRPPRRLRFTQAGALLTLAIVALGFATLNTGNNLLYLVLGGLLGLIMLSGWLSEQSIRGLRITRRLPRAAVAHETTRISYDISNLKPRFPTLALEMIEGGTPVTAFVGVAEAGKTVSVRAELQPARRGVLRFGKITLRTSFPFGLFVKERDIHIAGTLLVWPRSDRPVHEPRRAGERVRKTGSSVPLGAGANRGEYRSLRPYLPGDDPRDVHWRSTARAGEPVVREYERDASDTLWICLDLRAQPDDAAEAAVEIAASLAARAERAGTRYGLATNDLLIDAGNGPGQLEAIFDELARARFKPDTRPMALPADPAHCVLVRAHGGADARYADTFSGVES